MRVTSFIIVNRLSFSGFHILCDWYCASRSPERNETQSYDNVKAINGALICVCLLLSQILELTLLMASYINHWNPSLPSAPAQPLGHWDVDSRHFPAMNYTTKGPTLLWTLQATTTTQTVWLQGDRLLSSSTFVWSALRCSSGFSKQVLGDYIFYF